MKRNSKKPEVRKQELIEIAAKLFAEKGYEAVSVRDILDVVDGAPGMFYYYFKSKNESAGYWKTIPFRFLKNLLRSVV